MLFVRGRDLLRRWRRELHEAVRDVPGRHVLLGSDVGRGRPHVHRVRARNLCERTLVLELRDSHRHGLQLKAERLVPCRHVLLRGLLDNGGPRLHSLRPRHTLALALLLNLHDHCVQGLP